MDKKVVVKADGIIVAESDKSSILQIEGNYYFPKNSTRKEYFSESDFKTECPWKGTANYFNLELDGSSIDNAAWYYPSIKKGASEIVAKQNEGKNGGDFSNYIAFYTNKGIIIEEE